MKGSRRADALMSCVWHGTGHASAPVKRPTAEDPSNTIAPKELQINRKSCDIWPYSLTPTCSDPDIGDKVMRPCVCRRIHACPAPFVTKHPAMPPAPAPVCPVRLS